MSASVSDTAEGHGESFLKHWLTSNRLSGLQKKLLVEAEINAEELLDFALNTKEAIQFCEDFKVPGLLQKRFIKALQTFPAAYAQQNGDKNINNNDENVPKLIVATLSKEEEEIIDKVNAQRKINKTLNEKIDNLLQNINEKEKLCDNEINHIFSVFEQELKKSRDKLRADLENICKEKKNKLLSSKQKIKECNDKIKKFQTKNTQLLMNWQMDKNDRRQQIVQNGNNIINNKSFPTKQTSQNMVPENITIKFKIDQDAAIKFMSEMGAIVDTKPPGAPNINIHEVTYSSVTVGATYDKSCDIENLQVELCVSDIKCDDEKLEWEENIFEVNNVNQKYVLGNLKSNSKYVLRAKVKNKNGWSNYCDVSTLQTKKVVITFAKYNNNHWTVSNNGKTLKGKGTNCCSSAVYSENGYNTGVHVWTVKAIKRSGCNEKIGITSGERNVSSKRGTNYYLYSFKGHAYHSSYPWGNENDVITVKLDCNNWKVTISNNKKGTLLDKSIESNQTYYFAMSGCGNGNCHYEIIDQ